mmetsp:Transcript_58527/g.186513  ORF Transcript_58527/g.186513 Transcript_58527/m.186513 type:complete len:219 (-) Transcript_58527:840-1496(-)
MSDKDTLLVRRAGEENRNETLLEEGRFVDSVKTYNHCVCCIASVTVAPLAALLYHPVRYGIKAAYDSYDLRLTDRNLIWSSGYYGCCCCCWNESERIVPLEKITDVTYSQNWLQKLFGVDSLAVRTASGAVGGEGGGADISLEVRPAPCTLHAARCTLHPTTCTLHPTPCTLHPAPYTLVTPMRSASRPAGLCRGWMRRARRGRMERRHETEPNPHLT